MQNNNRTDDDEELENIDDIFAENIDKIQARYGWKDNIILDLPFARYCQICNVVLKANNDIVLQDYRTIAFGIWIERGKKGLSFDKFLNIIGIGDKPKKYKKISKEEATKKGLEVLEKFKTAKSIRKVSN